MVLVSVSVVWEEPGGGSMCGSAVSNPGRVMCYDVSARMIGLLHVYHGGRYLEAVQCV